MPQHPQSPIHKIYDVVIIGGAIYGSAIAWFLANNTNFSGSILVVEKDPSYEFSSTARTNSCIRQQFSTKINILISQFGASYIKNFQYHMNNDKRIPELTFNSFGYLYLAKTKTFAEVLKKSQKVQCEMGAKTKFMNSAEIQRNYPFYNVSDIIGGNHNRVDEGYFDGTTMFEWWKKCAKERGAEYINNEVSSLKLNTKKTHVEEIILKSGCKISCHKVINASGPYAAKISKMAGINIPVQPRKRYSFVFKAEKPLDQYLPLTIDPSGVHMRSDGSYYLAGCPPDYDQKVEFDDFEMDHSIWETKVWPCLANRIPQFEAIRLINSWVGHYAFNTLDQNAIVGYHPKIQNFVFSNGFSGHGLQQSPAIGRGISELIIYNKFKSIDLSPLNFLRIEEKKPFKESAII